MMYIGELSGDLEHGRGVLTHQDIRIVGAWDQGRLVEELVELWVPSNEVESVVHGSAEQQVFVSTRAPDRAAAGIPSDAGNSLLLLTNGDKYIGAVQNGAKQGKGMYVCADGSCYKGQWEDNRFEGSMAPEQTDLRRVHQANMHHALAVDQLKRQLDTDKKQLPPVPRAIAS